MISYLEFKVRVLSHPLATLISNVYDLQKLRKHTESIVIMMDELINEIRDIVKTNRKILMPSSTNHGQAVDQPSVFEKTNFEQCNKLAERDYIKQYKEKDDEEYLQLTNNVIFNKNNYMDNMSDITGTTEASSIRNHTTRIYQTYNFAYRPMIDLPILSIRDKIVSMIAGNSVVVVRGSTGCGKTTQLPQLILDAEYKRNQHCNIIVTQPRRIAALSIAKRVSHERGWPVGTLIGYQMGLIKNTSNDTRITYCTTGVLLHKLINKKHMMDYTHVILDEVHERDEDMDFLILIVKRLLRTNSTSVKVILMSATIDVNKFAEYFSTCMGNKLLPAPVIDIPRGNPYNISIYYLDELENLGDIPEVSEDEPKFTRLMIDFCIRLIHGLDRIDKKNSEKRDVNEKPAILIFLPGIQEIDELHAMLLSLEDTNTKWDIVILHSLISTEDQENAFKKPPKGHRRIILSTNIAESSVTVPDIKYVIDFCLTKLMIIENDTNYQCLKLCWASKSSCQQRAGRAGRVMNGRVYRMVPKLFYDTVLSDETVPEMLRAPLANVVLKTKILDMGEPKALLALSLDPPNLSDLKNTMLLLKEAGALLNRHDNVQEFDGDLTPLGRIMAALPLNINVTKLIILGHIFGVLQDAIIIAASMSVKNMFNIEFDAMESTYYEKLHWASNSDSDNIACLNAFKVWRKDKAARRIFSGRTEKEWARRNSLRVKSLREIDALVADITAKLRTFGIKDYMGNDKRTWESHHVNSTFVIKVIIAGAFYPNYFVKQQNNITHYQKEISKILSDRDPKNTVYLRGWPLNQPGLLYSKRIQKIFAHHMGLENHDDITVSFDGSSRVYIEYEKSKRTSDDIFFIQNAIKIRQYRIPIEVDLLTETEASHYAKELGFTDFQRTSSNAQITPCNRFMYADKPYPDLPNQSQSRYTKSKVTLQGPFSPIEMDLTHLAAVGASKTVSIETMSVNSVLLDTCPENPKGVLLVAQTITQGSKNAMHLTLRNTTVLPNTPGLVSLIILIFTPYMELRRNSIGTRYTGALCGLGYDRSTGQSIFPEHDLANIFDIEITMKDLQAINKLRHWMNIAMHFRENVEEDDQGELTISCQNQIKSAFTEVIYKTRKTQELILTNNFHKWNRYDETLFLEPARETLRRNNIYTLHRALELNEKNTKLEDTIRHLLELEQLAYEDPHSVSIKPVSCKLCLTKMHGIINLRTHLCSEQHKAQLRQIDTTGEFGEDLQSILTNLKL